MVVCAEPFCTRGSELTIGLPEQRVANGREVDTGDNHTRGMMVGIIHAVAQSVALIGVVA